MERAGYTTIPERLYREFRVPDCLVNTLSSIAKLKSGSYETANITYIY